MRCGWLLAFAFSAAAAEPMWQIGTVDRDTAGFAHSPADYGACAGDALFVVGRSDPARDWPYAHPGPADFWGGSRPHTFTVAFALAEVPAEGEGRLVLDLVDTHASQPPRLRIAVNDAVSEVALPAGGGDASINGQPKQGRAHQIGVPVRAAHLRAGLNQIRITTLAGSWLLYDALSFEAPAGTQLGEPHGTLLQSVDAPPMLVRRGGALRQLIRATVQHLDPPARGWLAAGTQSLPVELKPGEQQLELPLEPVDKPVETTVRLRCGEQLATLPVTLRPVRRWTVFVLPHSHVDIGYTKLQTELEADHWRYFEQAIELAKQTAGNPEGSRFKWNVEVLWAVEGYLKQATPEQRQRFGEAVRKGWIGLDAMYANMLTGLCSPEELLRLYRFATKLREEFGVPLDSAMISDVPGYTWGLVPAMQQAGVKYFSPGTNGGERIGYILQAWGDKPFYWVGPSGREKVLTWFAGYGYGGAVMRCEDLLGRLAALEARGYPYDMMYTRHCLGDNAGPDAGLAERVKAWNAAVAYPHIQIATTHEAFAAFEARWGARLPRYSGDLTGYWEDGAASSARETALARNAADRLSQAEALYAMRDRRAYPAAEFDAAWRNVMLFNEHTWGAWNSISDPDSAFARGQWAIKRQFALDAEAQSKALLHRALGEPVEPSGSVEAVDVINTAVGPACRSDLVRIPAGWAPTPCRVVGPDGEEVPSQRLSTGELAFRPNELESWALQRYRLEHVEPRRPATELGGAVSASTTGLANEWWSIVVDPVSGEITSLREDEDELVDRSAGFGLNAYRYVLGRDPRAAQVNGPVRITVVEPGPIVAKLRIESDAPGCRSLVRELELVRGDPALTITNTIDKLPVRDKEAIRFGFPFAGSAASRVTVESGWAAVEPEHGQLPGACRNQLNCSRWVQLSPALSLATLDAPLIELGQPRTDGAWTDRLVPSSHLWSYVMNNYWGTNYCADQEGLVTFRYRLEREGMTGSPATDETRHPVLVRPASGSASDRALADWLLGELDVQGIKPADDGAGWIVRLRPSGRELPTPLVERYRVWLSDLSERRGEPVTPRTRLPRTTLCTLRLEPRR